MFSSYITVPVYAAFYRWLGYGDEIDPMVAAWESGDRQAAAAAAPWELIEEMFVFGSPEEMKERIAAFVEGGITLPILTPITTPDAARRADCRFSPRLTARAGEAWRRRSGCGRPRPWRRPARPSPG